MAAMLRSAALRLASMTPGWFKRWADRHPRVRRQLSRVYRFVCFGGGERRAWGVIDVRQGALRGLKLVVDEATPAYCYIGDNYEPHIHDTLRAVCREGMVVADIGANVGYHTLMLARWVGPGGRVISFEPDPSTFARLKRNVEANGMSQVKLFNLAVSDRPGELRFAAAKRSEFSRVIGADAEYKAGSVTSARHEAITAEIITVPCTTLDAVLAEHRLPPPGLIKMDVEDHEINVLRGAAVMLKTARPIMLIEVHSARSLTECVRLLDPLGYRYTPVSAGESFATLLDRIRRGDTLTRDDYDRGHVLCEAT